MYGVPADWRHAGVSPLYKSRPFNKLANYKPISLTSIFSNLREHIIFTNIVQFLDAYNVMF